MPVSLPAILKLPLLDFSAEEADIGEECEYESGESRRAPIYRSVPTAVQVKWAMNQAEFDAFHDWFEDDLLAGSLTFNLPVMQQGGVVTALEEAMFLDTPDCTLIHSSSGGSWELSAPCVIGATIPVPAGAFGFNPALLGLRWALSNGNLTGSINADDADASQGNIRSVVGRTTPFYFEFLFTVNATGATGRQIMVGACNDACDKNTKLGYADPEENSISYDNFGNVILSGGFVNSLPAWSEPSDVIGMAYIPASGKVWFSKNGVFDGDPAAGTDEAATGPTGTIYAAVGLDSVNNSGSAVVLVAGTGRFTASTQTYPAPAGFTPLEE
jgi:hypothetical protein